MSDLTAWALFGFGVCGWLAFFAACELLSRERDRERERADAAEGYCRVADEAVRSLERRIDGIAAAQRERDERIWDDDDVLAAMELDLIQRTPKREK